MLPVILIPKTICASGSDRAPKNTRYWPIRH